MFTGVYCRGNREEKSMLWNELEECRNKWDGKWIIGGDFNMTLRREERRGSSFSTSEASEFKEVMERLGMVDLLLSKKQWTWSNQKSKSKIDRFFISCFLLDLTCVNQKTLSRRISDHYLICIEAEGIQWSLIPFRLDNKWLGKENFRQLVEETWKNSDIQGCASYRFAHKHKALKNAIKEWAKEELEQRKMLFDSVIAEINDMDSREEAVGL